MLGLNKQSRATSASVRLGTTATNMAPRVPVPAMKIAYYVKDDRTSNSKTRPIVMSAIKRAT